MKYATKRRPLRRQDAVSQHLLTPSNEASSFVFQPPAPPVLCTPGTKIGNLTLSSSLQRDFPEFISNGIIVIRSGSSNKSLEPSVPSDSVENFFKYEYDALLNQAHTEFNLEANKRNALHASLLEAVLPLSFEYDIVEKEYPALLSIVEELNKSNASLIDVQQHEDSENFDYRSESLLSDSYVESTFEPVPTERICCRIGYPTLVRYGHCDSVQLLLHNNGSIDRLYHFKSGIAGFVYQDQYKNGVAGFVFQDVEYNYRKRRRQEQC